VTLPELLDLLSSLSEAPGEREGLSELDHGLQCAHELSLTHPKDKELQVAGLVHDIGHQFASDQDHGRYGAERVRSLLGDRVAALVELHIPAKRYLVATDPTYRAALTDVSVVSLGIQGGVMSSDEVETFLSLPWASDAVALRRADDAAKVVGQVVPPLEKWLPMLQEVGH
jgi:predicted HD phosphohydrolase